MRLVGRSARVFVGRDPMVMARRDRFSSHAGHDFSSGVASQRGEVLAERIHACRSDITRIPIFRAESATPLVHHSGVQPLVDGRAECLCPSREELRAVVEDGVTDPARRKTSAHTSTLVDHEHVLACFGQAAGGDQTRQARTDDQGFCHGFHRSDGG